MEETRKYILDRFEEHLHSGFDNYCTRHGIEKNQRQFVTYLIDQNLISHAHLQRFTVQKEFEKICVDHQAPKTLVVDTLANRFMISERTVWSILRNVKSGKK